MAKQTAIRIEGLRETQANMDRTARELTGAPMVSAMRRATTIVERQAKINAPVDTGRLRSSITDEVRVDGNAVQGIVGTPVTYAPYMELGTGTFVGKSRYFPPSDALDLWARRHGTTGFVVARAIWRRGGLRPRRYLQRTLEDNVARVSAIIGRAVSGIVER